MKPIFFSSQSISQAGVFVWFFPEVADSTDIKNVRYTALKWKFSFLIAAVEVGTAL